MEANLRACVAHGLALHVAIMLAFAGLLHQPKVLARFKDVLAERSPAPRSTTSATIGGAMNAPADEVRSMTRSRRSR
ncbi:hypothetical protein [Sphaerisporangium fuscum]|uniref:hypothetical protein n=1 Tax=Sphaerisporangium fuscum TaxID=2835868 RepID=UPI001BDBBAB2|nr:hypothetical protein [Sphaerisporangium fuscum]